MIYFDGCVSVKWNNNSSFTTIKPFGWWSVNICFTIKSVVSCFCRLPFVQDVEYGNISHLGDCDGEFVNSLPFLLSFLLTVRPPQIPGEFSSCFSTTQIEKLCLVWKFGLSSQSQYKVRSGVERKCVNLFFSEMNWFLSKTVIGMPYLKAFLSRGCLRFWKDGTNSEQNAEWTLDRFIVSNIQGRIKLSFAFCSKWHLRSTKLAFWQNMKRSLAISAVFMAENEKLDPKSIWTLKKLKISVQTNSLYL